MENSETDCRSVLERLYLYLDGEIAPEDGTDIGRHIRDCLPCQDHADFEQQFKELVRRKVCKEEVPSDLLSRVRANLDSMT